MEERKSYFNSDQLALALTIIESLRRKNASLEGENKKLREQMGELEAELGRAKKEIQGAFDEGMEFGLDNPGGLS